MPAVQTPLWWTILPLVLKCVSYVSCAVGLWKAIAPAEIVLSIGIVGFLALIFVLGLKYLELLPARKQVKKAVEEPPEESVGGAGEEVAEENKEALEPAEGSVAASEG